MSGVRHNKGFSQCRVAVDARKHLLTGTVGVSCETMFSERQRVAYDEITFGYILILDFGTEIYELDM